MKPIAVIDSASLEDDYFSNSILGYIVVNPPPRSTMPESSPNNSRIPE